MKQPVNIIVFLLLIFFIHGVGHAGTTIRKIDGKKLDDLLRGKSGQYVLVAMAAWCKPCKKELPILNKLYSEYKDRGLEIVGISLDMEGPQAMQPLIEKLGVAFPVYWAGEDAIFEYDISKIPMLLFAKDGRIQEKIYGKHSEAFLRKKIETFLK